MTAAVGIQAPPDKASSPPEFRRMEERWKETVMKSLAKRFSSKNVLFVRKAEMIVFADENDVRTTRKLRIEGLLAVVPFTDQLVIFPETVNTIILWNTEADKLPSSHPTWGELEKEGKVIRGNGMDLLSFLRTLQEPKE
jgi:hypothetical protein